MLVTKRVRFSFPHVFEAHAMEEGQQKKYSVCIIIPKTATSHLKELRAAIKAAFEKGVAEGKFGKKTADMTWKNPLRDGDKDRPDDAAYIDSYFINCTTNNKPGVVGADREPLSAAEFYSGCYGRVSLNFYAFNVSGNKGIAAGLNNVQKLADGERLSGGSSAEDDFADEEEDEAADADDIDMPF